MRFLVIGSTGYLGNAITHIFARAHEVYAGHFKSECHIAGVTPLQFDIAKPAEITTAFDRARPDAIVHCAALPKADYCEQHPDEAKSINADATAVIARECNRRGLRLIHISTDLVFDGTKGNYTEEDPVNGISVYARSKIQAEAAVQSESPESVILRVGVLYGPGNSLHPGFLDETMSRWRKLESMTFFTDQFRTPTFTPQVAEAVERFAQHPRISGIFHLGSAERLSRYDFAVLLARTVGADQNLLKRGSMLQHTGPAKRGSDCSLVSQKIRRVLGLEARSCSDGLLQLLREGFLQRL